MPFRDTLVTPTYLLRGAITWFLARALISAVIIAAQGDPFVLSMRSAVIIIVVSTALAFAQTFRYHESAFLGNVGVARTPLALYFALPALLGELMIAVLRRVLG